MIKRIIIVIIKVLHYIFIYSSLGCQAISFEDVHIGHITQHVEVERDMTFVVIWKEEIITFEALLATSLVSDQLYLQPP